MSTQSVESEVRDRLDIVDTLYRFAAGLDFNDLKLLESVFTADLERGVSIKQRRK